MEVCVQEVPELKMCALRVSSHTQSGILEARSKILTFGPAGPGLPQGQRTVLLSGPRKGGEVYRHFIQQGPRNLSQPHQTLPMLQRLEVPVSKRPTDQTWLQN